MKYSVFSLLKEAFRGHAGWTPAWREAEPKADYDVVIVGGGGHGLATAYYLAKEHGITNVAVLEKGYIGSGNAGRNTTIIRSNYLLPGNEPFYEWSMKLWEGLEQDSTTTRWSASAACSTSTTPTRSATPSRAAATPCACTASMPSCSTATACARMVPFLDFDNARFPIQGGLLQRRGGTVRHDAVAWGYARGADRRGVDIIQNCEVTGIRIERRPRHRRRDHARLHPGEEGRPRGRRQHLARRRDGGPAAADREPRAAGLRVGRHQAADRSAS